MFRMKNERYYYGILSDGEKRVYKAIYDGINRRALNIYVRADCPEYAVQDIYRKVLCDHPVFFFINQRVLKMGRLSDGYLLMPEYLYSINESRAINKEIKRVIARVMNRADQWKDNCFRLEKYIHDSVVKSVAYDYDALNAGECYNAHSIVGAFLEHKAVCEGIAKAFKLLCNIYGMKCMVVLGKANPEGNFSGDTYHAWNIIKLGRGSYHVDVTWDSDAAFPHGAGNIRYDYFNLTTEEIMADHLPMVEIPICNASIFNFFHYTKSMVNTDRELKALIEDRICSKSIMFKLSERYNDYAHMELVLNKTSGYVQSAMRKKFTKRMFAITMNEKMHIVCVRFL